MSESENEKVALVKQALVKLREARDVLSDFKEQNQSILRQERELEAICLSEEAACQKQLNDWFWGRYVMAGSWDTRSCCHKCAGGMKVKKNKLP